MGIKQLFLAFTVFSVAAAGAAETPPARLTEEQLTAIIRESSHNPMKSGVTVASLSGGCATVLADESQKSSDEDRKIKAILLAKTVMENASSQVETVKVVYSQPGTDGLFVTIGKKEIADYGSGKLTPEQLLSSIHLVPVVKAEAPKVSQGPLYERRLLVWKQIDRLKRAGTGVQPFENLFNELDAAAKAGQTDGLSQKVEFLETKLEEQETNLKMAKKSARGLGVPAASRQPETAHSAAPTSAGSSALTYIPPQAEELMRGYRSTVEEIMRRAQTKGGSEFLQLKALRAEVDRLFASGNKPEAFMKLHSFQILAMRLTGIDLAMPDSGGGNSGGSAGGPLGGGPPDMGGPMGDFGGPPDGGPPGGGPPGGGPPGGGGGRGGRR